MIKEAWLTDSTPAPIYPCKSNVAFSICKEDRRFRFSNNKRTLESQKRIIQRERMRIKTVFITSKEKKRLTLAAIEKSNQFLHHKKTRHSISEMPGEKRNCYLVTDTLRRPLPH